MITFSTRRAQPEIDGTKKHYYLLQEIIQQLQLALLRLAHVVLILGVWVEGLAMGPW